MNQDKHAGKLYREAFGMRPACRRFSKASDAAESKSKTSHPRPGRLAALGVCFLLLLTSALFAPSAFASSADALFRYATNAYFAGDYSQAAGAFAQSAALYASSGTLQNLGNAEWQLGRPGPAIVAWEQALWLNPFNQAARNNLHFARRTAQLESPDLAWYEAVSSWLPANCWAWLAAVSLWLAVGVSTVPGIFRWPKASWHQALAAFGLAVFLLSVPAHLGISSRARLGFIIVKDAPLRLTPTADAQFLARLPEGEPVRLARRHGRFWLIHSSHATGWIRQSEVRLICSPSGAAPSPASK